MSRARDPGQPAKESRSLVFRLLERYCTDNGLRLTAGDPYGHAGLVESPSGKRWFFKGTHFDLNPLGASEIADDKAYAANFLKAAGIAVPDTCFILAADVRKSGGLPEDLREFLSSRPFPLFVKPNIGQEGRGVMRAGNLQDLTAALRGLADTNEHLLVQSEIPGREFRVIVLDGEVLCAIERHPPGIIGDGRSTVSELIGAHAKIDPADVRLASELARQDMTFESIPEQDRTVSLMPVANLSAGGTASVVTASLEPDLRAVACKAAETLGLRYAGVDLILPDGMPPVVLEVNTAPGLSNLYRQSPGEAALVEEIYAKVFGALFGS